MKKLKIGFLIIVWLFAITVLAQDGDTIADIVTAAAEADEAEFTMLLDFVISTDLIAALADDEAEFTVFAPTDAAFEALLEKLELEVDDLLEAPDMLEDILLYHIAEGQITAAGLTKRESVVTLQGGEIAVSVNDDDQIVLNDVAVIGDEAIEAANGIIHIIDAVLLPPASTNTAEACSVSTTVSDTVRVRVGPGINRTSVSFLPVNQAFEPLGQAEDDDGNSWFQLDKEQAAPGRSINEAWVAADELEIDGDCSTIGEAIAPPIIPIINQPPPAAVPADTSSTDGGDGTDSTDSAEQPASVETGTLPANGTYTFTLAEMSNVSCQGTNSVPFPSREIWDSTAIRVVVRSSPQSISLDGDPVAYAGPGYYTGQFNIASDIVATTQLFTATSSTFSGRLNFSFTLDGRGCSVGTGFTAAR